MNEEHTSSSCQAIGLSSSGRPDQANLRSMAVWTGRRVQRSPETESAQEDGLKSTVSFTRQSSSFSRFLRSRSTLWLRASDESRRGGAVAAVMGVWAGLDTVVGSGAEGASLEVEAVGVRSTSWARERSKGSALGPAS